MYWDVNMDKFTKEKIEPLIEGKILKENTYVYVKTSSFEGYACFK